MEKAIETAQLTKEFNSFKVVDGLSLSVFNNDVYGFLGPNGAGKSTTIRMLLGLIKPSAGEIKIFGEKTRDGERGWLQKIGAMVERPDFYPYLSGIDNLKLLSKLFPFSIAEKRIFEVFDLVGLTGNEKKSVKNYSQGMKQRLGLAHALVHNPELLILDEPTNGLDPQGVIDIRNLIIDLKNSFGKTIVISSHILSEIEIIANRMALINKGKLIAEGDVKQLLGEQELKVTFEMKSTLGLEGIINSNKLFDNNPIIKGNSLSLKISKDKIPMVNKMLVDQGFEIKAIVPVRPLEEYFLQMV